MSDEMGMCPFCAAEGVKLSSGPYIYKTKGATRDWLVPCCEECLLKAHQMLVFSGAVIVGETGKR